MLRRVGWSAALLVCGSAFVACATYEGLPTQMNSLGDAGAPGTGASDGGKSTGGTSAGMTSAGKTSVGGNASGGSGGRGGSEPSMEGGTAGIETAGGKAGTSGAGGSAGKAGSGGSGGTAGNAGSGGTGGAGGTGGKGGSAGAGGSGTAPCSSKSPDATCSCVANAAHDYWFCTTYLSFAAAEKKCTAAGMHLPKVETKAEDDFIFATTAAKTMGEYYLGATDAATADTWLWLAGGQFWKGVADGTASGYAHWSANEPNASGDCLVVQSNGPWDDRICTDQRKYICEAPP
jgi:Lectin C-type domain